MSQIELKLSVLEGPFTVHQFPAHREIPRQVYEDGFYSISKTEDELSIVCSSSVPVDSERSEAGWSCIKVVGPLDFSLVGILAEISAVLAAAKISILALSTFDTDYILVKSEKLLLAREALLASGHTFMQ